MLRYEKGDVVERRALTSHECSDVEAWLNAHASGWMPDFGDYAPRVRATLHHADGTVTTVNVIPPSVIVVHEHREYARDFASSDLDALSRAMGASTTANNRWRGP